MSPRELDPATVQSRLDEMQTLLADLQSLGNVTTADLASGRMLRHGIERILQQLVDLAVGTNSHVAAAIGGDAHGGSSPDHQRAVPASRAQPYHQ